MAGASSPCLSRKLSTCSSLDDYIISDYSKGKNDAVNFYVAYYASQRKGYSPHSPIVCIPGGGWQITKFERTSYHSKALGITLPLNRVVIARDKNKQLVYYWFVQRGRNVANEYWAKWLLFVDAITKNRTDGALVRLVTPFYPGESEQAADERLQSFIEELEQRLSAYLPPETLPDAKSVLQRTGGSSVIGLLAMIPSFNLSFVTIRRIILVFAVFLIAGCSSPEEKAQRYYERGMELLSKQDYVKAGIEFKNAVQNKKDLVGAWRGLLEVELHNRNVQGAVPILRTIVELDPKDVDSKLKLGHYLLVAGDVDQALDLANAAIALDDRNPNALALKAAALLKLKDATGAKREAQAALDIDPANAEAVIVLAVERMIRGDTEGALSILDRPGVTYKTEDEFAIQLVKLQIFEKTGDSETAGGSASKTR